MLGHRGCRLGITKPEIYKMQTEAIFRSAIKLHQQGQEIKPEIMVPLVGNVKELRFVKNTIDETAKKCSRRQGWSSSTW